APHSLARRYARERRLVLRYSPGDGEEPLAGAARRQRGARPPVV
ncbi:MAG: hypothetical protein AVDCRST_MAG77-773, partial [uncultured Chloroflexi bacterium]